MCYAHTVHFTGYRQDAVFRKQVHRRLRNLPPFQEESTQNGYTFPLNDKELVSRVLVPPASIVIKSLLSMINRCINFV